MVVGTAVLAAALAVVPTAAQAQERYYNNYGYQNRYAEHEQHEAREARERARERREHLRREREHRYFEQRYRDGDGYRDGYRDRY